MFYFGKEPNFATWFQSAIKLSSKLRLTRFLNSVIWPRSEISLPPNWRSCNRGNWFASISTSFQEINVWFNESVFKLDKQSPCGGGDKSLDWLYKKRVLDSTYMLLI